MNQNKSPHRLIIFVMMIGLLAIISPSSAQDAVPAEVTEVVTEEAPPAVVEPTLIPTEVPLPPTLEPTPLPTEITTIAPTSEPTQTPTTEVTDVMEITPEVTVLPTVEATSEVTPEVEATPEATLDASLTEIPAETLTVVEPFAAFGVPCDFNTAVTRASIMPDGTQFAEESEFIAMAADGRYVVFRMYEDNVASQPHTLIYDRQTCQSNLLPDYPKDLPSVPFPGISTGRYVVHHVPTGRWDGNFGEIVEIYVYDQMTGQDVLVSKGFDGSPPNETSINAFLSASGRYIAYESYASNLVSGDVEWCPGDVGDPGYNCPDLFLYDMQTGQNIRIALADGSASWDEIGFISGVRISANDQFVVYQKQTTACFPYCSIIRLYEIQTGQTRSVPNPFPDLSALEYLSSPSISANGRYLAYIYNPGSVQIGNIPPNIGQIAWYDIEQNYTNIYSRDINKSAFYGNGNSSSPLISGDGRFVLYTSEASNQVIGDTNGLEDVFLFDRFSARTTRISVGVNGQQANGRSIGAFLSPTAFYQIAFTSLASNLVADDTNEGQDVFVSTYTLSGFTEPPSPAILISPANGATIDDNTPLLTWNAAANAEVYNIEVDDNPDFRSLEVQILSHIPTSYDVQRWLPDGVYYWAVESRNELTLTRSSTNSFRIDTVLPDPPRLQYPANDTTISNSRPAFSWRAVSNARRYRIQVASDASFNNVLVDTMEASTVKAPITLLPGHYFWRIATQNTKNVWGDFGGYWSFDYTIMQSPVHNGHSFGAFPIFTWNAYPKVRRYQLEIDNNREFNSPEFSCIYRYDVLSARPCTPNGLPYGDHYWRVNIDLGSGFITSPIIYAMSYVVRDMPTPKPISPIGANVLPAGPVVLTWSAVDGAQTYEFQVAFNSAFTENLGGGTGLVVTQIGGGFYTPRRYYWRVRAWFPGGKPGLWTTASFEVR
jgi:hypothetical protein